MAGIQKQKRFERKMFRVSHVEIVYGRVSRDLDGWSNGKNLIRANTPTALCPFSARHLGR
jgi:hypothetical protein